MAAALWSCSDDMAPGSPEGGERVTIVAELDATEANSRSCVDESTLNKKHIDLLWETTDTVGAFGTTTRNAMFLTTDSRTSSARFTGLINDGDTPTGVYYPYSATVGTDPSNLKGTLSLTQDYWRAYPRVDNDWRIGTATSTEGVYRFSHLFTLLHFSINASGVEELTDQKLESIILTVTGPSGEKRQLGGDFTFSLTDGFKGFTNNPDNSNVMTMRWRDTPALGSATYNGFITCAPNIHKGDKLNIEIRTTTKTVTIVREALADLQAHAVYTFPLTLSNFTDRTVADRSDVDEEALYHPCMILRDKDIARIQQTIRTNRALAAVHRRILDICESYMPLSPVEAHSGSGRWQDANGVSLAELGEIRIMSLAYAYRMTLDRRYAERAIKEMEALADMSTWSGYQALDAAEVVTDMAYGYDWLYSVMTDAQRSKVRSALVSKGIDAVTGIISKTNNQNSIGNCGAVTAGLALMKAPGYTGQYQTAYNQAKSSNGKVLATYSTGNYPGGPAYWGYGTAYQVLLFQALEDVQGESAYTSILGSYESGFVKSCRWMVMTCGSSGLTFNYSDTRPLTVVDMAPFWFAYKYNDNTYAYTEIQDMKKDPENKPGGSMADQFLVPLMSLASRVDFENINTPDQNYLVLNSSDDTQPLFLFRTGWDSQSSYLGVKGGKANNTHGHMDAGSFVYDYKGVRWAFDLGGQEYSLFETYGNGELWKYYNGSGRWTIYRCKNIAHNTIVIDNAEHTTLTKKQEQDKVVSNAGLATVAANSDNRGCTVNMKNALNFGTNTVQSATRNISLDGNDYLTVTDAVKANRNSNNTLTWNLITDASATISGNVITLTKNGQTMYLTVPSGASAFVESIEKAANKWDVTNPGMSRVGYTYSISKGSTATLTTTLREVK